MRFRTLALALALACGMSAIGEAKQKPKHPATHKVRTGNVKPTKPRKFKASKFKQRKHVVAKRTVKH